MIDPLAPLTVLRGPGGAGKSVLVGQWAAEHPDIVGAWVTIEESTASRDGFWRHVLDRLLGQERAVQYVGGSGAATTGVIEALDEVEGDVVIVVDDAHHLQGDAVADDIIEVVRSTSARFIVLTRSPVGSLEDAEAQLSIDARVIGASSLTFSLEEIDELAATSGLSARELMTASGGNALLLRALILGRSDQAQPRMSTQDLAERLVLEYVDRLDHDQRHFMLRTSLGDEFTIEEAEALVGPGAHATMIDAIELRGLLTRTRNGSYERFKYHPVVRETLRRRLERQFANDVPSLHKIIARRRAEVGDLVDAFNHGILGRDYALATDMMIRGGTTILRSGGADTALTVSLRVATSYPLLAMARALVENARRKPWVAREYFAAALVAGRSHTRSASERAALAVSESVINRLSGRTAEAAQAARRALELIERAGAEAFGDQLTELYSQCAVSFFRAEAWEDMLRVLEHVPTTSPRGGLTSASLRAAYSARRGLWDDVSVLRADVTEAGWPVFARDGYAGAMLHLAEMLRDLAHGDTAGVRAHAKLYDDATTLEFRVPILAVSGLADLVDGYAERTIQAMADLRLEESGKSRLSPEQERLIAIVESIAQSAIGDFSAAERLVARHRGPWATLAKAFAALLANDTTKAVRHLTSPSLTASDDARVAQMQQVLLAWRAIDFGDPVAASDVARSLQRSADLSVLRDLAIVIPDEIRPALIEAAGHGGPIAGILTAAPPSPFARRSARPRLTERELAVIVELRTGRGNADIARVLNISTNTLKTQLRSAYSKLGVSNREDALARTAALGLFRSIEHRD